MKTAWILISGLLIASPAFADPNDSLAMIVGEDHAPPPRSSVEPVVEEFSSLRSWVDFPETYVRSVIERASSMTAGYDVNGHFVVLVDRAKSRQAIFVLYVSDDGQDWNVAYQGHVSTGKPGRKEHFLTPTGVFDLDGSILDYRAEGTYNANHIRGIGLKGSRVWDFGWQDTDDWRTPGAKMKIRMEMHATDPANLEQRIGRADSEGCIRIHADLNALLDRYGILDAAAGQMAQSGDARWAQVLGKSHVFMPEAGRYLVIVDSDDSGS